MLKRLPLRTELSIAVTVLAGVALVIALASRGSPEARRQVASGGTYRPPGAPVTASTTQSTPAARAPARLNPHPVVTVAGKPSSGAPPVVPPLPKNLPVDDVAAVRQLLVSELGPNDNGGEPSVRAASCIRGMCVIAYRVDGQGAGLVFGDQALIWKRLFADPRVRRVTLLVYHSDVGEPGAGRLPLYEETCDRSAAAVVAGAADYGTVARLCRVVTRSAPQAAGGP